MFYHLLGDALLGHLQLVHLKHLSVLAVEERVGGGGDEHSFSLFGLDEFLIGGGEGEGEGLVHLEIGQFGQ